MSPRKKCIFQRKANEDISSWDWLRPMAGAVKKSAPRVASTNRIMKGSSHVTINYLGLHQNIFGLKQRIICAILMLRRNGGVLLPSPRFHESSLRPIFQKQLLWKIWFARKIEQKGHDIPVPQGHSRFQNDPEPTARRWGRALGSWFHVCDVIINPIPISNHHYSELHETEPTIRSPLSTLYA